MHEKVKTKIELVKCEKLALSDLSQCDYILVHYYRDQELLHFISRDNCYP